MKIKYGTPRHEPNGKPLLILERKKGSLETETCAFCGTKHVHGTLDSHRVPHCAGNKVEEFVVAQDGTKLYQKDGYLVKTIN